MHPEPEESPDFTVFVKENGKVQGFLLQEFQDRLTAFFGGDAE